MPEHQKEKEVPQSGMGQQKVYGLPELVAFHIAGVMRDRTKMKDMENTLDVYIKTLSDKAAHRDEIKQQLTDGRLALESLLQRFLSS